MARRKKKRSKRTKPDAGTSARAARDGPKTSAEKLVEQAEGLETLAPIAPILRLFGSRGRKAAGALSEARGLASQARELNTLPGRFNAALGPRGWIAYERMNHQLLRRATELAEAGEFEEAETVLVDALDEDTLRFQLDSMVAVEAYRPRADLLRLAAEDFGAGRYHAVVPVVLAQIDGIVADVAGRALFSNTKDILPKLIAWDSISAQEGGLPDLVELMATQRHVRQALVQPEAATDHSNPNGQAAADAPPAGGPAGVHPDRLRRGCGLRAGHRRDHGPAAPLGAVPADRLRERGAGSVLAGEGWGDEVTTVHSARDLARGAYGGA
jgi:hypothetical protein